MPTNRRNSYGQHDVFLISTLDPLKLTHRMYGMAWQAEISKEGNFKFQLAFRSRVWVRHGTDRETDRQTTVIIA